MFRLVALLSSLILMNNCSPSKSPVSVVIPSEKLVVSSGSNISLTCKVYQTVNSSLSVWRVKKQSSSTKSELKINKVRFDSRPYFSSVLYFTDLQRGEDVELYCYDKLVRMHVERLMSELELTSEFLGEELRVECKVEGSPPPSLSISVLTYSYSGDSVMLEHIVSQTEHTLNSSSSRWNFNTQELLDKVNCTCVAVQEIRTDKKALNKTLSFGVPRDLAMSMSVSGKEVKSGSVVPVTVGRKVEIICEADSYPPQALLALSHNNILLASDNNPSNRDVLTVSFNFTAASSGLYICSTVPKGGCKEVRPCSTSVNFTLSLQIPVVSLLQLPDLNLTVTNNSSTSSVDVRLGSHPYVRCVGSGIPPPIQVSLKIDDTYVSYTTSGEHDSNSLETNSNSLVTDSNSLVTDSNSLVTNSNSLVTNSNSLVTGRFVPVDSSTTVVCIAWQECHYENCSQATQVVLNPSSEPAIMTTTKATVLFFTTFVGSFLSLLTVFSIFLICVDCCSHNKTEENTKPNLRSPTASLKSFFNYFSSQKSTVKRPKTKRPSVKDIRFSLLRQDTPQDEQTREQTRDQTRDQAREQTRVSLFPEEISPESKPSGHLSWDGTFETGLLEELDELVAQYTDFGTESLCSGCNDLRENCAGKSNVSLSSSERELKSEEDLAKFFSTCELNLNDEQQRFMSPAENDYESIGCESPLTLNFELS